ncbi:unnamed protein product [Caenorhabditis auriculariae]|uniref:Uncharacterized protein n=1 Tax=Caenorhabditis auriculariae TaxID=2777116 RepID=A0A8S1HX87_9PELO|nr:unnamed protein product [Caenorhabditis auriculariae]
MRMCGPVFVQSSQCLELRRMGSLHNERDSLFDRNALSAKCSDGPTRSFDSEPHFLFDKPNATVATTSMRINVPSYDPHILLNPEKCELSSTKLDYIPQLKALLWRSQKEQDHLRYFFYDSNSEPRTEENLQETVYYYDFKPVFYKKKLLSEEDRTIEDLQKIIYNSKLEELRESDSSDEDSFAKTQEDLQTVYYFDLEPNSNVSNEKPCSANKQSREAKTTGHFTRLTFGPTAAPPLTPQFDATRMTTLTVAATASTWLLEALLPSPVELFQEDPVLVLALQVSWMVCMCCRTCCKCCKCAKGKRRDEEEADSDEYTVPGAIHIPVPVYRKGGGGRRGGRSASAPQVHSMPVFPSLVASSSILKSSSSSHRHSMWERSLDVATDVRPLATPPVSFADEPLPWIDSGGDNPTCCREKRKPGFRPLRGSSLPPEIAGGSPWTGTSRSTEPVPSDSSRRLRKRKMEKRSGQSSGGGFFQRWFGGYNSGNNLNQSDVEKEEEKHEHIHTRDIEPQELTKTTMQLSSVYAELTAKHRCQRRHGNVHFVDEFGYGKSVPVESAFAERAHLQYRPRAPQQQHRGPVSRGAPTSSMNQLDEATLDLLRLSTEPTQSNTMSPVATRRVPPPDVSGKLPKAASTSSVNRVVKTKDGGQLRLANVFTWDQEANDERKSRSTRLSPQAEQRNEERSLKIHHIKRKEQEIEYEEHRQKPPVVRTTVEGKLKMEKIVGADLITVDSCVSSAWTVRDTVTNYKIKTTIGKKSIILEEMKEGQSKYKITLIENGETKMEREASLDVPDFMNKKDYLAEVSQRLLQDLKEDGELVTAVTHVEVEVVEDVTNILKTYVIGERADDYLAEEQLRLHYEQTADKTPPELAIQKVERIYVDEFQREDSSLDPEKAEIRLTQDGMHYQGETALSRVKRYETEESMDRTVVRMEPRCAHAFADCDLTRKEDSSTYTVKISVPLVHVISLLLKQTKLRRQQKAQAYELEQEGKRFEQETTLQRTKRYETTDSVEEHHAHAVEIIEQPFERIQEQQITKSSMRFEEHEARGGQYEMEQEGQRLKGETVFKRRGRAIDSESSEELPPPEREATGGQYEMEIEGVSLRGETKFRKSGKRYESESEESQMSWQTGSPTLVELVKKESNSLFEATFETVNSHTPVGFDIKRAVMKKESCSVGCSIMKPASDAEGISKVLPEGNRWKENYSGRELSETYADLTIGLQNQRLQGRNEQSTENNMAGKASEKTSGRFREMKEEQAMMLCGFENSQPSRAEADVTRKEKTTATTSFEAMAAETEHVTVATTIFHSGDALGIEGSSKTANVSQTQASFKELSEEHATNVIFLQKIGGPSQEYAEGRAKDKETRSFSLRTKAASEATANLISTIARSSSYPNEMSLAKTFSAANKHQVELRSWASESHIANSTMMLNRSSKQESASKLLKHSHRQASEAFIAEYGNVAENCAVLLKNTGGVHDGATSTLAEAVTGGSYSISSPHVAPSATTKSHQELDARLFTCTANKRFNLTNYRTLIPPSGNARITFGCPQTGSAASFHLSNLSEHSAYNDESFNQDLRVRRKDAKSEITIYILYKKVYGNFAQATLGLAMSQSRRSEAYEYSRKEEYRYEEDWISRRTMLEQECYSNVYIELGDEMEIMCAIGQSVMVVG